MTPTDHAPNLLADLPTRGPEEVVEVILETPTARLERIVSYGHASPRGFWYDQEDAEWVTVLSGRARLRFEDETEGRTLGPGDQVYIAPHRRHRVVETGVREPTIWLALFVK